MTKYKGEYPKRRRLDYTHFPEDAKIERIGLDFGYTNEVEVHETKSDRKVLALVVATLIITGIVVLWEPDVEAIGTWVYNAIK